MSMRYYANVYWHPPNADSKARAIGARARFAQAGCTVGPVGTTEDNPHIRPGYQISYSEEMRQTVEAIIDEYKSDLSIYIHNRQIQKGDPSHSNPFSQNHDARSTRNCDNDDDDPRDYQDHVRGNTETGGSSGHWVGEKVDSNVKWVHRKINSSSDDNYRFHGYGNVNAN